MVPFQPHSAGGLRAGPSWDASVRARDHQVLRLIASAQRSSIEVVCSYIGSAEIQDLPRAREALQRRGMRAIANFISQHPCLLLSARCADGNSHVVLAAELVWGPRRAFAVRRVARAQQELEGRNLQDTHSEEAHQILRSIYFPGWKHRPHLTQVRESACVCPSLHLQPHAQPLRRAWLGSCAGS